MMQTIIIYYLLVLVSLALGLFVMVILQGLHVGALLLLPCTGSLARAAPLRLVAFYYDRSPERDHLISAMTVCTIYMYLLLFITLAREGYRLVITFTFGLCHPVQVVGYVIRNFRKFKFQQLQPASQQPQLALAMPMPWHALYVLFDFKNQLTLVFSLFSAAVLTLLVGCSSCAIFTMGTASGFNRLNLLRLNWACSPSS